MAHDHFRERIPGTPRFKEKDKQKPIGYEPFFPNFLLKEWIVGSLFLVAFILWIVFNPVELTDMANPADNSFIPVPDWYFLFLYELLKYFTGPWVWMGTFIIPTFASMLLVMAPWLDTTKPRHPFKRPIATASMMVALLLMVGMTYEAHAMHEDALAAAPKKPSTKDMPADVKLVDTTDPGYKIFSQTCAGCHGADLKGNIGPFLLGIGNKMTPDKLLETVTHGFPPNMPPAGGLQNPDDVKTVVAWLSKQKQK